MNIKGYPEIIKDYRPAARTYSKHVFKYPSGGKITPATDIPDSTNSAAIPPLFPPISPPEREGSDFLFSSLLQTCNTSLA